MWSWLSALYVVYLPSLLSVIVVNIFRARFVCARALVEAIVVSHIAASGGVLFFNVEAVQPFSLTASSLLPEVHSILPDSIIVIVRKKVKVNRTATSLSPLGSVS